LSNKNVFSRLLNTVSEDAAMMLVGRLSHACGTVTRNQRSPIVFQTLRWHSQLTFTFKAIHLQSLHYLHSLISRYQPPRNVYSRQESSHIFAYLRCFNR